MTEQRVPLSGSSRDAVTGAQPLGDVDPGERVAFTVLVRRRAALPSELVEGPDTVSTAELADRFGADPADAERVRAAFTAAGVTVSQAHHGSRRLFCHGPAEAVTSLFGTQLTRVRGTSPTGDPVEHRARSGELAVPAALDGVVVAVLGLDTRPQVRPYVRAHAAAAEPTGFPVPGLATVYDFPDTDGAGRIAAVVEFGGGYGQDDLDAFFGGLAIPTPKITAVGVDGAQNVAGRAPTGADPEVLLDVEVLGALAPKAELLVYFAPNTDQGFVNAITTAIHATPSPAVLSISWGMSEDQWTAQTRQALDSAFADAAALGVTVCAAAGDTGSQDCDTSGGQHVDFPASSQYVLACGGTSLTVGPDGHVLTETVWNDGDATTAATGGGVSDVVALPAWQRRAGVPPRAGATTTGRGVPDVAAVADPATGYRVRVDGKDTVLGGTSAVAPLWAALICRLTQSLGRPLGLINPLIYAANAAACFRDVTGGGNGAYQATTGWDPCAGIGVPHGTALLAALGATAAAPAAATPATAPTPSATTGTAT